MWTDPSEAKQATEILLPMWTDITVDDALELLGPSVHDRRVREYAVRQLEKASDEDVMLYLLQLVQAIKFEEVSEVSEDFFGSITLCSLLTTPT